MVPSANGAINPDPVPPVIKTETNNVSAAPLPLKPNPSKLAKTTKILIIVILLVVVSSAMVVVRLKQPKPATPPEVYVAETIPASGIGSIHWVGDNIKRPGVNWAYDSSDYWSIIEAQEGQYNWASFDEDINKAQSEGKKVWLQPQTMDDVVLAKNMPPWALDQKMEYFMANCGNYTVKDQPVEIAAIWDPLYRDKLSRMLKAMATRYNNNPYVEAIEMMGGGNYGEMTIKIKCGPGQDCGTPDVLNPNCSAVRSMAKTLLKQTNASPTEADIVNKAKQLASYSDCQKNPATSWGREGNSTCYVFDDYYIEAVKDMVKKYAEAFTAKPIVIQIGYGLSGAERIYQNVAQWAVATYGSHVWLKFNGFGPTADFFYNKRFNNDFGTKTRHGFEIGTPWFFARSFWKDYAKQWCQAQGSAKPSVCPADPNATVDQAKADEIARLAISTAVQSGITNDKSSYLGMQDDFFSDKPIDRGNGKFGNEYYFNPNDSDSSCSSSEISNWCPGYLNSAMSQVAVDPPPGVPSPDPSLNPSPSPSVIASLSPTVSPTPKISPSLTPSPSPTPSPDVNIGGISSPIPSPFLTPTPTFNPSLSPQIPSPKLTPSPLSSRLPSPSPSTKNALPKSPSPSPVLRVFPIPSSITRILPIPKKIVLPCGKWWFRFLCRLY